MVLRSSKRGFVEAGHGSAVEEVEMTSDDKQKKGYYYYYLAYDPWGAKDVMTKSLVGIDGPGLESDRVRGPYTRVVVGEGQKRTSDKTDRPLDYQDYSRMEVLAETKQKMNH